MRIPTPAGRKPSPRPRATNADPHDEASADPDDAETAPDPADRDRVSDEDSDDPAAAADETVDTPRRRPRWRVAARALLRPRRILAALLVLAVLGGLGFAASEFFTQRAEKHARSEALAAAKRYAVDLSSYDYQDLNGNFQAVERNSTGAFGKQYRQVSTNLTDLIKQHQATSEGKVVRAGVAEASGDRAVVVLFVDQTISNTNTEQPRVDRNRMEMTLLHQEDRWLVDNVTLL